MTMDIEPYNLDYEDQKVAWCQEIFKIMKPSEQAEFLADIQPKPDMTVEEVIAKYKALSFEDKRTFRKETRLLHKESIDSTLEGFETSLINLLEDIKNTRADQ